MTTEVLLMVAAIVGLGIYNWQLQTKIADLEEQIDHFMEMVLEMANELQDLGSPNVKVMDAKEKDL